MAYPLVGGKGQVMTLRWIAVGGVAVVVAAVIVTVLSSPSPPPPKPSEPVDQPSLVRPQRPSAPPELGRDQPRPVLEPQVPEDTAERHYNAYAAAVAAGAKNPGELAFRATVDSFLDHNAAFAEAQAKDEGITVSEVHELTYFGFLVMQTQRWPDVEELLDRPLSEDERGQGEALMHNMNSEFKTQMRELVAHGAKESERWELIRDMQDRYFTRYYELTGMNGELLDQLLAGDISRSMAPAATPIPQGMPPADYQPPQSRPVAP